MNRGSDERRVFENIASEYIAWMVTELASMETIRSRTSYAALGAAVLALGILLPVTGRAEIVDRIVARVNDEVITSYELDEAVTPYLLQNGQRPSALEDPEQRERIRQEVLQEMIDRQLIIEEAEKMGLEVNDQQVDRWLKMTRQRQNMSEQQFRQLVERYDMTYAEYREMVRKNLLKMRLVKVKLGRQVSVDDEEIDEAYRERYGSASGGAVQVKVRHILIRPEGGGDDARQRAKAKAKEALKRLESGEASFEKLAREYSDGPSAEKGGLLGTFGRGDLNEALADAAFELDAGEHSGVVESQYGFHIVRVDERSKGEAPDVQKRKKRIRQRLRQQKLQEQVDVYTDKLREKAFVEVKL